MELQQLFLCLLGSTCVVHLLTMAAQTLQRSSGRRLSYQARSQTAVQTTRDDWYVFFTALTCLERRVCLSLHNKKEPGSLRQWKSAGNRHPGHGSGCDLGVTMQSKSRGRIVNKVGRQPGCS
jgi:hypothetical protein